MAYTYNQSNVVNLKHLKKAVARTQNEVTSLAALVVGTIEDMILQANITVLKTAWGTNKDAATLAEGYNYKADVSISGLIESANVTVIFSAGSLAKAFSAGMCPIITVGNGSITFYSKTVPTENLTGIINAVQLASD